MSEEGLTADQVAASLRGKLAGPWDVFVDEARRYEIHLSGDRIEMRRGPLSLEGFGLRLFRPSGDRIGVGFAASSDPSPESIRAAIENAESTAVLARSPASKITLPSPATHPAATPPTVDQRLWDSPEEELEAYAHELLSGVQNRGEVVPSFGNVHATLLRSSIANSEGVSARFAHTLVDMEFALKAFGGPEGRPPGEYWINRQTREIPRKGVQAEVAEWCVRAQDVRKAVLTPHGAGKVLFPVSVMSDVLPVILGFRFSGVAVVRKMAPEPGTTVASPLVSVADDGLFPMSTGTGPVDDEGALHRRTPLIESGKFAAPILDSLYGGALGGAPTGNGHRDSIGFSSWVRFRSSPGPKPSTLVIPPGTGGSDEELMAAAGDGIWLDQLGYAFPDPVTSAFGGEVRLGYRIRNGKRAEPIRGGTVGGFALGPAETPPLLASVTALGSRASLSGRLSAPTMLVEGFPVASTG